jgi:hypothetical protein
MKDVHAKLAAWSELHRQSKKLESLAHQAREAHRHQGGPDPTEIETELKALKARADAAFQLTTDALRMRGIDVRFENGPPAPQRGLFADASEPRS